MADRSKLVREELQKVGRDTKGVGTALTADPKARQRRDLGWRVLYGTIAAMSALAARRAASRSWSVLTGEAPPTSRPRNGATPPRAPLFPPPGAGPTAREERAYERAHGRPLPDAAPADDGNGENHRSPSQNGDDAPSPQPELTEPTLDDPGLTDLSKRDWIAIFKRAAKESLDDNVPMIASALAYSTFFAIPSVLLVVVGLFTVFASPDTITNLMEHFRTFMPGDATRLLRDSLTQLESKPSSGILMTIVGLVLAVWSVTGAMNAYMTALNIAYDRKDSRSFPKKRLVALEMAAAIGFAFILIAVLLIFGPAIERWVGTTLHIQPVLSWVWWLAQWPLLVAGLLAAFATMYWLGPDVEHPRWRFLTVGSVIAVVAWIGASGLFALYTAMFASYNKTWGSLSAVIVMLTWLWLTGIAVLFGAEVNAEAERSRELRAGVAAEDGVEAPRK